MFHYLIEHTSRRDFVVKDSVGRVLGSMAFSGWFGHQAVGTFADQQLSIRGEGFWRRRLRVHVNKDDIGTLRFSWGTMSIDLTLGDTRWPMRLRHKGFFRSREVLSTDQGVPLMELVPRMRWFAAPNYEVTLIGTHWPEDRITLMLLITGFAAAVLRAHRTAAAAAA